MKSPAIAELKRLALEYMLRKYPEVPYLESSIHHYSDKKANGLTRCIIDFLRFSGQQSERVSNMGKYVDQREHYLDVLGHHRVVGSGKWIPGQGTKGSADIHSVINGRAVKIEVKIGRDKLSEDQKRYQQQIEAAGGIYFVARDFEGFYYWYIKTFTN